MQSTSSSSLSDEVIYVQQSVSTQVPPQVSAIRSEPNDSWSQGADHGHEFLHDSANHQTSGHSPTVPTTLHANWSDDERTDKVSDHKDSVAISGGASNILSDSDDSSSGSAAMLTTRTITQPSTITLQLPAHGAPAPAPSPARKCHGLNAIGPLAIVLSLGILGCGTYALLKGTDVVPRDVGVDGKLFEKDGYLLGGLLATGVSMVLCIIGGSLIKFCWKED